MKINNIHHNDFYRNPPQPKWAFDLFIDIPDEVYPASDKELFSKAVHKIDIPTRQMLMVQSRFQGLTFDIPTRQENGGTASITFNEDENMRIYRAIRDLLFDKSFNPNGYIEDEWSKKDEKGNYIDKFFLWYNPFDIYVKFYDPIDFSGSSYKLSNGAPNSDFNYCYVLKSCYFESIGECEFNYDGSSEETVEFTCQVHFNAMFEGNDAEVFFSDLEERRNGGQHIDSYESPPSYGDEELAGRAKDIYHGNYIEKTETDIKTIFEDLVAEGYSEKQIEIIAGKLKVMEIENKNIADVNPELYINQRKPAIVEDSIGAPEQEIQIIADEILSGAFGDSSSWKSELEEDGYNERDIERIGVKVEDGILDEATTIIFNAKGNTFKTNPMNYYDASGNLMVEKVENDINKTVKLEGETAEKIKARVIRNLANNT